MSFDEPLNQLAKKVFDRQFELDPILEQEYDGRQKRLMFNDILYNLGYLDTAMKFNDERIFIDYAVWIYQLLCYLMKNLDRTRIKDHMVLHYRILNEALSAVLPVDEAQKASLHLQNAIRESYPTTKISVGGLAFQATDELWVKWNMDFYSENAQQFVEWADRNIVNLG